MPYGLRYFQYGDSDRAYRTENKENTMVKTIKASIITVAVLLLSWFLPWMYSFIFAKPYWSPFTLYSCIVHTFASIDYDEDGNMKGRDFNGKTYTEHQFDSILPVFYARQLASENRFPESIEGMPVSLESAEKSSFIFRSAPSDLNRKKPGIYQILESRPDRVNFKTPDDVFRITENGIEFVDIKTNKINVRKSEIFSEALKQTGFAFPAAIISGNSNTKKEYDNGYLITDSSGSLFHIRQEHGSPKTAKINIPGNLEISDIFVTEFPDRKLLGFISGVNGELMALSAEDYSIHEVPVGGFFPRKEQIMIVGDMFYWTVNIQSLESERIVAVNPRNWKCVESHTPEIKVEKWEKVQEYIFPFSLEFISPLDEYIRPRIENISLKALWTGAFLMLLYAAGSYFCKKRNKPGYDKNSGGIFISIFLYSAILVFGIYAFIPLIVFNGMK